MDQNNKVEYFTTCENCEAEITSAIFDEAWNKINWKCSNCGDEGGLLEWIINCENCGRYISQVDECNCED